MKNYTGIIYQIKQALGDDEIKTQDILNSLNSITITREELKNIRNKLIELSSKFSEAVSLIKEEEPITQDVFDAVYFYKEVLGKNKATFNLWKRNGFFKNELGSERNQKVTLKEIENFLMDPRYKKYSKFWKNR